MSIEKGRFIDIDDIQQRLSVSQVASHYGFPLPANFGTSGEQRMRCPCSDCSGSEDDASVSINLSDAMKRWKCHRENYGCGAQGRLVNLAYCMKHGRMPPGGKLSGSDFLDIAKELEALTGGEAIPAAKTQSKNSVPQAQQKTTERIEATVQLKTNVPLAQSDNENARKLTDLDGHLITDLERMSPAASLYARRHPVLLSEQIAREVRAGYMPGKIKSSLRNNWVYGIMDRQGEPLAWVGRNIKYDTDHTDWIDKGRQGREPNKFRFPNQTLFRRGSELYGQEWLDDERFEESLAKQGLILVEGFNDRIRLHELGIMSLAMMSNTMTDEQTHKLIGYAKEKAKRRIGIMHDANRRGDDGAKESLWRLHEAGIDAYLIWSHNKQGGRYADREPESLTQDEWKELTKENGRS